VDVSTDFAHAEQLLLEAEFQDCRSLWYSSNYVYLARLCAGDRQFAGIYKPEAGESPLWDFPTGALYRREVAAYRLSRLLEWNFIPPTVPREGPQGLGSVQLYIEHDPASHFFEQRENPEYVAQLKRMAVFDYVVNNADRKGGHCLLDEAGRIWGIDHGLCFHPQYKMRTVIWDWADEPIPGEWLDELETGVLDIIDESEASAPFRAVMERDELGALVSRAERLLATRTFPLPGPHRSYPWPLV
jgi:uncharacterized repeat protein (TIGR03843 family)